MTAGLAVLLTCGTLTGAQHQIEMTTGEAAQRARVVVAARVIDVSVRREGNIYTFVEFETTEVAKGTIGERFTYRMLGGRIGNDEVGSGTDMPHFAPGEEVVLFLGPEVSPDGFPTLFTSHVYRVTTSRSGAKLVSPPPTGLSMPLVGGPSVGPGPGRLTDFMAAVRAAKP